MKSFEDRVEEVLGALHGLAWPLLDEADKRKIVGKIAKGIDTYGDTCAAWGRALGCDKSTVLRRVERFRRSEPIDGIARNAETQRKRLSHARSVLRDPAMSVVAKVEVMQEALRDPLVRAAVQNHIDRPVEHLMQPSAAPPLEEAWGDWLNRANGLLMHGVRLEERTERSRIELGAHAAAARTIYQRLTERKLDAEIRQLFDETADDLR